MATEALINARPDAKGENVRRPYFFFFLPSLYFIIRCRRLVCVRIYWLFEFLYVRPANTPDRLSTRNSLLLRRARFQLSYASTQGLSKKYIPIINTSMEPVSRFKPSGCRVLKQHFLYSEICFAASTVWRFRSTHEISTFCLSNVASSLTKT